MERNLFFIAAKSLVYANEKIILVDELHCLGVLHTGSHTILYMPLGNPHLAWSRQVTVLLAWNIKNVHFHFCHPPLAILTLFLL